MLRVEDVVAGYQAGSRVLDGLDLDIRQGEIVALLGRNGMGKSTLMRVLTGHLPVQSGSFALAGTDLTRQPPYAIANAGIGYVPQGRDVFKDFTVEENLLMGVLGKRKLGGKLPPDVFETFSILGERRGQKAGTLSGGQQQQLAIMRALVGRPELLLLDEPSEGIQPSIVQEIGRTLADIARRSGLTILVVEQNLDLVEQLADRVMFVENGRIADSVDDVGRLRSDPDLLHRYLSI